MTAPFPTRKQEEWRYADLDALRPVWQQFAEPLTLTVGPGESFEKVWLPGGDDVQVRRVQIALEAGAKARIFVLNTARGIWPDRARGQPRRRRRFRAVRAPTSAAACRPTRSSPTSRHIGVGGRSRQTIRSRAQRQGGRLLSRQGRGRARRAEDRRRAVGQGHAARPRRDRQLQARARDLRRRREVRARRDRRRAGRDAIVLRREPRPRPGERARAAARRLRHGPVGRASTGRRRDRATPRATR